MSRWRSIEIPSHIDVFWRRFVATPGAPADAYERFHESFRIGSDDEEADEGARLILSGRKTATSSLLWEYQDRGAEPPRTGVLSVVEDGRRDAACVIETTWVEVIRFDDVDATLAHDYGESDRTLEGWRKMCWEHYSRACGALGREMSGDAPLVCERFRVVFPGK